MSDVLSDSSAGFREFDADQTAARGPDGQQGSPAPKADHDEEATLPAGVPEGKWPDFLAALDRGTLPRLGQPRRGRRLVSKDAPAKAAVTPQQSSLLLDIWQPSGLPAGDFAALVGLSKHTLYLWKKKFDTQGPAGLMDQPRGVPHVTEFRIEFRATPYLILYISALGA